MRTIALEEHFATPAFLDGPGSDLKEKASRFGAAAATLIERLCDVGEKRIAEMDAAKQLPVSSADRARIAHGNAERLFGF